MPPKAKFTKQQIAEAGLAIVRRDGMEGVTARAISVQLGSSACPIFTVFENMEEVHAEILRAARAVYAEYIRRGLAEPLAFRGVGMQYILFAIQEPKLFHLLFMTHPMFVPENLPQQPDIRSVLPIIDDSYDAILRSVQEEYQLPLDKAEQLYRHLWIYTHGIAVLCATNLCSFTQTEITAMMGEVFRGILREIKEGMQ